MRVHWLIQLEYYLLDNNTYKVEKESDDMAKAITVIMGSPRKGNSDKLAQAFIDGAIEKGNTVYKVIVKKCV